MSYIIRNCFKNCVRQNELLPKTVQMTKPITKEGKRNGEKEEAYISIQARATFEVLYVITSFILTKKGEQ